jgi:hypothetical protein
MEEIKHDWVRSWVRSTGQTKKLVAEFLTMLNANFYEILEFRMEKEIADIYDGPYLVDTIPSGVLKVEMRIILSREIKKEKQNEKTGG